MVTFSTGIDYILKNGFGIFSAYVVGQRLALRENSATETSIWGGLFVLFFDWDSPPFFFFFFLLFFFLLPAPLEMPSSRTVFLKGSIWLFWPISTSVTVITTSVCFNDDCHVKFSNWLEFTLTCSTKLVQVRCCESNLVLYFYLLICLNCLVSGILMNNWRA